MNDFLPLDVRPQAEGKDIERIMHKLEHATKDDPTLVVVSATVAFLGELIIKHFHVGIWHQARTLAERLLYNYLKNHLPKGSRRKV